MADERIVKLKQLTDLMRDVGASYVDYVKPLTWLLHIKMAAETAGDVFGEWSRIASAPVGRQERALLDVLNAHAPQANRPVSASQMVFAGAFNPWGNGKTLNKIIKVVGAEVWSGGDPTRQGALYEALLAKGAVDVRQGFGQYFTPRPLVEALVEVMAPRAGERVHDPACGTGGFLVAAAQHASGVTVSGCELVDVTARLAQENLILHGITAPSASPVIAVGDALASPGPEADVVLANPPFGNGAGDRAERGDWWVQTSDKQVGFVQHIMRQLAPGGRAAVVVPDNVLFGTGAAETVRRVLTEPGGEYALHTLLRLPTGIFYADGVKTNVLFIDRAAPGGDAHNGLWVYDLRTGSSFTQKRRPLTRTDLDDFVECFQADPGETCDSGNPRWRWFSPDELAERPHLSLDLTWTAAEPPAEFPDPVALVEEIAAELQEALKHLEKMAAGLRATMPRYTKAPEPKVAPKPPPNEVPATGGGMQQLIPLEGDRWP